MKILLDKYCKSFKEVCTYDVIVIPTQFLIYLLNDKEEINKTALESYIEEIDKMKIKEYKEIDRNHEYYFNQK